MGLEERTQNERPHARADWRQMLLVGTIASALGIAAAFLIPWFPTAASDEAGPIDTLWHVLLIVSIPVFVGVTVVVLFAVFRFRMRAGEENLDGPPIHGNTRLEVIWTAIPAIVLVGLCTYAFVVLENVEAVEGQPLEVRVVGEQFTWTYFLDQNGKEVATSELHLPVGRQVRFTLGSKDVLHSFWVPAFRIKKDTVPGIDVKYTVTPSKVGKFPVVCAELCGLGHAVMRSSVVVEEQEKWDTWLADLGKPAATPEGGGAAQPVDAKAIFSDQCGSCHTLADAGTNGTIGPDLDDVLADKDEAFIKESIVEPNKVIADGYQSGIMPPNYGQTLQAAQVDGLAKYLSEVTKGG